MHRPCSLEWTAQVWLGGLNKVSTVQAAGSTARASEALLRYPETAPNAAGTLTSRRLPTLRCGPFEDAARTARPLRIRLLSATTRDRGVGRPGLRRQEGQPE